jgi:hypothetical protein
MLKVKSDQLAALTGERRPRAAEPAPAPVAMMPATQQVDVDKLAQAVLAIAAQQRENNEIVRQALARPRVMEADIQRNKDGRATKIIITVTEKE